jgi:1-acyl-sn-glycerol-3-phosphate acyltransferase
MTALRSLIFNILFFGGSAMASFVLLWSLVLPRRFTLAGIRGYLHYVGLIERTIIGLRYHVEDRHNMPDGPCIVAAKHQSAWETLKLHLWFRDPAIVLKKELLDIPVWGLYARRAKLIPIDRNGGRKAVSAMLVTARAAIAEGRPIVIFPQGTRVAAGTWQDYKAGVGILYAALNVPMVPVALNSGVFWGRQSYTKRSGDITVRFMPVIPAGLPREEAMRRLITDLEGESDRLVQAVGGPATQIPDAYKASPKG